MLIVFTSVTEVVVCSKKASELNRRQQREQRKSNRSDSFQCVLPGIDDFSAQIFLLLTLVAAVSRYGLGAN